MKKVFCFIAILAFLTTLNSGIRSDNDIYNEITSKKTHYYWDGDTWKVIQRGADSEGDGSNGSVYTYTANAAAQFKLCHFLYAYSYYSSSYEDPKIKGTWHLRAKINPLIEPDGEPFEDDGDIVGKVDGMSNNGDHEDTDWFNTYHPVFTFPHCDSYSKAEVTIPSSGEKHESQAYTPSFTDNVHLIEEKP